MKLLPSGVLLLAGAALGNTWAWAQPNTWRKVEIVRYVQIRDAQQEAYQRQAAIDLKIERNPRGRREPASTNLPLHLTYPGEALPVLEQLFAAQPIAA